MKRFLRTTTAMVLTASLALPGPLAAQEIDFDITGMTKQEIVEEILRRGIVEGENARGMAEALAARALAKQGAAGEIEAEAEAEIDSEAEVEAEVETEAEAATETEAEAGTEAEVETEVEAGTDVDPGASGEGDEETPAPTDLGEELPETQSDAEGDMTAAQGDETVAEDDAELTGTGNAENGETGEAEIIVETDTATETGTETEAEAEAEAETDPAAEGSQDAGDATDATGDAAEADAGAEERATTSTGDADPEPMDSETQAEQEAELAAESQDAMAAGGDDEAEAEVVEETVTDDTARSSSEEFDTDVTGEARAQAGAEDEDDDDDGLSNAQKAALLGLGTIALSQILGPDEEVVTNTGDRVVVERNGQFRVIKNDDALLRRPGSEVKTYRYEDGSSRTVVTRPNGIQVETIRARDGRVLRRTRILEDGSEIVLFDDTQQTREVAVNELPQTTDRRQVDFRKVQADDLAAALQAAQAEGVDRRFSLSQVRNIDKVRELVPEINVDTINFETNSAVIRPEEARELAALGRAISSMIEENPGEVFLIEGHTDAVGPAQYNLALSDRRAESVALALTEYFDVPPENLVVQGYGETDLLVQTQEAERANRRAAVRRITPLLRARR